MITACSVLPKTISCHVNRCAGVFFPQPGRSMSIVRPEIDCPIEIVFFKPGSRIRGLSRHGVQLRYPEFLYISADHNIVMVFVAFVPPVYKHP